MAAAHGVTLPQKDGCAKHSDSQAGKGDGAPVVQRADGESKHGGDQPTDGDHGDHRPRRKKSCGQRGRLWFDVLVHRVQLNPETAVGSLYRCASSRSHRDRVMAAAVPEDVNVIDVDDPTDPRLDDFRDLNSVDRRPDLPSGKGLVIAEGVLVAQRMLASRFEPRALLGTERRLFELGADLSGLAVPFYRATAEVMAEVVGFHLNRGVLASASRAAELTVTQVLDGARTVAVLEGVNDHENLGSVFRNAAGLGVDAVIFGSGCADPLYRRAVRVSMGHALLVPFARAAQWPADLNLFRDNGFRVLAMTPDPMAQTLAEAMTGLAGQRLAILVGAEGPGLQEHTMRSADARVRIPMSRGTDSLNVATAAALAFYERDRLGG